MPPTWRATALRPPCAYTPLLPPWPLPASSLSASSLRGHPPPFCSCERGRACPESVCAGPPRFSLCSLRCRSRSSSARPEATTTLTRSLTYTVSGFCSLSRALKITWCLVGGAGGVWRAALELSCLATRECREPRARLSLHARLASRGSRARLSARGSLGMGVEYAGGATRQ